MEKTGSAKWIFTALVLISLALVFLIMRPFGEALIFAAVLGGALMPVQDRLAARLRGHRDASAALVCLLVVLALLVPFGGIAAFVVRESVAGGRYIAETIQSEGVTGLIDELPVGLRDVADRLLEKFPIEEESIDATLQEQASAQGGKAARAVTGALAATGSLLVQTVMMLIALFFLLVDGKRLVHWIEEVSPLAAGQALELLREFRKVSVSVLVSTLATAGVQAIAALCGYLVTGLRHPFFFAVVTFFTAMIPAVGAGGMCLLGALFLLMQGKTWAAVFLAIWGLTVVGLVDNIIKPLLVKRGLQMHGAVVFFSLLGGLATFGPVGLLLGPLVVTFFLALVRIHQRDMERTRDSQSGLAVSTPEASPGSATPPASTP